VKRQKNDAADAEAIVIAAQRPAMRFVDPKSAEQQSRAILFRARERLVHQRTELVNALRAGLYEYGHVVPQGIHQIKRIAEILDARNSDLPNLMREECREWLEQIAEKTLRIDTRRPGRVWVPAATISMGLVGMARFAAMLSATDPAGR
jgi:transposase